MPTVAVSLCCLLVAGTALWGWGWAIERAAGVRYSRWPVTIGIGLAGVIFVGGVLNVARSARPLALDLVVALGVVGALAGLVVRRERERPRPGWGVLVPGLLLAVVAILVARCLVPPSAYNVHDDLEKYFAVPVRMLATGTLDANPLSSVGAETLGAQSLLHGFVAAHFPLSYLGAVDAWFGLILCLALVAFGRPVAGWGVGAAAAMVALLAIDPLIVNVSALFTGAALMITAVLLGVRLAEPEALPRHGLLLGLVYGALLALKPTFGAFVGLHGLGVIAVNTVSGPRRWSWLWWTLGGTALAVGPWLVLHAPLYRLSSASTGAIPAGPSQDVSLFSRALSGYGTAQLSYTLVALGALTAALVLAVLMVRRPAWRTPVRASAVAAGLMAAVIYFGFLLVGAPHVFGSYGATRYACPGLIALVPCMMRLLESSGDRRSRWIAAVQAGVAVAIAIVFLPATVDRPRLWWRQRTPLAFLSPASTTERLDYVAYNRRVFGGLARSRLAALQELVPSGEPIVVWVTTPFLLDFQRNPIFNTDPAGLSMRWTQWPAGARYFLAEYDGFAVHTVPLLQAALRSPLPIDRFTAERSLAFMEDVRKRAGAARVLANDGAFLLLRMDEAVSAPNGR